MEERMKQDEKLKRGRERQEQGERWVHPGWLMSCWRIIPTWAGREWEGESKENEICWSGDDNLWREGGGLGRKLIPPATWRRGKRLVVGSTLWRALRPDHVTMERWRDGNWGIVGAVGRGRKAAKRGDIEMIASRCMEGHLLWFITESRNLMKESTPLKSH